MCFQRYCRANRTTRNVCYCTMNHQILLLTLTPKKNRIFRRMCRLTYSKASCREAQPALKMQIKGVWGTPQQAFCNAKVAVVYTTALLAPAMRPFGLLFYKIHSPCTNKSDVQGLLAYRSYLNSFLSCSGLLKYSARYCERIFSVAIVLLMPVSSQNCSSWSLIVVASFMFRIFASFFCLGISVYSLKVVSLSPLNIFFKVLMEFDVCLESWCVVIGF